MQITKTLSSTILLACTVMLLGAAPGLLQQSDCPPDMVLTPMRTCIDVYEWPNKKGTKPLLGVSGLPEHRDTKAGIVMDAATLCGSVGKRVCTAQEWIKTCTGGGTFVYPWGDDAPKHGQKHACNTDKLWKAPNEKKIAERDQSEMTRLDQSEASGQREGCGTLEQVCDGKNADCVPYGGAYDMTGNAEEWVRCDGGVAGWCLAGRFWSAVWACKQLVMTHDPRWHYYETSTRCCKDI